jgi:serine/threonine-protein kinase
MPAFDPPLTGLEVAGAFPGMTVGAPLAPGGQGALFRTSQDGAADAVLKVYGAGTEIVRVEREIKQLQQIRSPYIVKLLSHGSVKLRGAQHQFTVTEFVGGADLATGSPMSDGEVNQLLHDVAIGIEVLWSKRLVHRDIKPGNVLRRAAGGFVIIDLGIAKHLEEDTVTRANCWIGTRGYMSPEQAAARRGLTFRSDLFALGVLAYRAATGTHPFLGKQELVGRVAPRPAHEISSVTRPTSELIHKLLQIDPMKRPRCCSEVYGMCRTEP